MSSVPLDLQPQVSFLKGALLLAVDVGTALCHRSQVVRRNLTVSIIDVFGKSPAGEAVPSPP